MHRIVSKEDGNWHDTTTKQVLQVTPGAVVEFQSYADAAYFVLSGRARWAQLGDGIDVPPEASEGVPEKPPAKKNAKKKAAK